MKNPFEEFWKRWSNIAHPEGDGLMGFALTKSEWFEFKKEFALLCEKQHQKEGKEINKMIQKNKKEFNSVRLCFINESYGKATTFRLVKPQMLTKENY